MIKAYRGIATTTAMAAIALVLALAFMGIGVGQAQALGVNDTFKKDGNTYKVTEAYENSSEIGEVILVKYGSSNTKPVINIVKYKGESFEVEVIGKNAFNNTKGHKITAITLGKHVDEIWAKAFYGCSKLKTINMGASEAVDIEKNKKGYYLDDVEIGAKAFAKAGVSGVKVKCGKSNASYQKLYKKALKAKGLRSDAKIVK